jgi:ABC-type nitrate/sulfonate/bicarbonate transport system substrate-binding protein
MARELDGKLRFLPWRTWPMGYAPEARTAGGPAGGVAPHERGRSPNLAPNRRVAAIVLGLVTLALAAWGGGPAATPGLVPAAPQATGPAVSAPPATGALTAPPTPAALTRASFNIGAQSADFLFVAIAARRGFFHEEGLDMALEPALGTVGIPAVVSGQWEFSASAGSAQAAIMQGAPMKVVMVAQERPAYGFFARPPIATIADLKGKQLGVNSLGSAAHIMANRVLAKHGLYPDQDFTWVALRTSTNLWPALSSGVVDASMISTADLHRPGKEGFVDLQVYRDPSVRNVSVGLVTGDRTLQERPDLVKRTIRGLIKAVQFMHADKAGTVAIMADFVGIPPEEAAELYDLNVETFTPRGYSDDDTLRQSIDMIMEATERTDAPPLAQIFDLSLARAAYAELQREGWQPR